MSHLGNYKHYLKYRKTKMIESEKLLETKLKNYGKQKYYSRKLY